MRKPEWLKVEYQDPKRINEVKKILNSLSLHTVCQEANCPNKMECYGKGTATFMVLGSVCTRNCRFCNVTKGSPELVDPMEPVHLAQAVEEMKLRHVVVTTVTRDDIPDGGAAHFARIIEEIRKRTPRTTIEVLISDLQGDRDALQTIVNARPEIINHNVETVPSLYSRVRPMADYRRSLDLLAGVKEMDPGVFTKSGIMVGLGETEEEVISLFADLRKVDCDFLTVGQYLAPSSAHLPVAEYVHPTIFHDYERAAYDLGFKHVASGPFVRSSYNAEKLQDLMQAKTPGDSQES